MLPLFIGSDLSSKNMSLIREHMEGCKRCRLELDSYIKSRELMLDWINRAEAEWNESQWIKSVEKVVRPAHWDRTTLAPWPFKKIWAYAFMVLAAFVFSMMLILPVFRESEGGMESTPYSISSYEKGKQDVITMTIVSKETGTKIVWFFDKNFQLEE